MQIDRLAKVASFFTAGLALVVGCSSESGSKPGSGGNGTAPVNGKTNTSGDGGAKTSTSATADFTCCLNDVYFVCPNRAATLKCATGGFDMEACMSQCTMEDFECQDACFDKLEKAKPDPSECTEQQGEKCPPSPPSPNTKTCSGIGAEACTYDHQCGSDRHCTNGQCFENVEGSKCQYDHQCGSGGHCTDGCCQENTSGTTCQYDHQCGSDNHCTNGSCHPNGAGSPCQYDHQCGSGGNCSNGECQ